MARRFESWHVVLKDGSYETTGGISGINTASVAPDRARRDAFGIPLDQRRVLDEKRAAEDIVLVDFVRWVQEKSREHFLEVPGA